MGEIARSSFGYNHDHRVVIVIINIVMIKIMIIPGLGKAAPRGRIFLVNIRNMDEMTISLMN